MACLADSGLRGVSLREAVAHREQNGSWPNKCIGLTFDDGFANFCDAGLPVLNRHGFSATMFLISGYMGKRNDWSISPEELGSQPILSWSQAMELSTAGIEIGSHTATHVDLRRCSEDEIRHELDVPKFEIENHLGVKVESFAYPYGGVNQASRQITARTYRAACTTELRCANGDALDMLPRIDMYYFRSLSRFRQLLNGKLDSYLAVRRWARMARRTIVSDY
jgi:peptidoglycan/xylan/chitin deacetylase (PgdA/CDA1 family)